MLNVSSNKQKEKMVLHTKDSKLDYVQAKKRDYRKANREAKTALLTEVVELTGYSRDYAAALLRTHHNLTKPRTKTKRLRARVYGPEVRDVVLAIHRALFGSCGELVQPELILMTDKLVSCGELARPSPEAMTLLAQISLSTVKRIMQENHARSYEQLKLHGGMTTPGKYLKAQIMVRVGFWDVTEPGYFEVDTVAHNGGDPNGTFIYTVNMTDVVTGWTEPEAIMGKGERATVWAIDHSREGLPYAMVALDSDGGGEFINYHLQRYAKKHKLNFTRSRPGQSNDNAHIEQKNRVAVRRLVGHARYDTPEQLIILQELYREYWRLYFNFFLPTRKVTHRSYDKLTGKARYTYDPARTPYQRVLDHPDIPEDAKEKLREEYATLNPIELLENIHRLEKELMDSLRTDGELDEIIK
jgi:hypothetical protein